MNVQIKVIAILAWTLWFIPSAVEAAATTPRVHIFKDQQGRQLEAEVLRVTNKDVTLGRVWDRKEFQLPFDKLETVDQEYLSKLEFTQALEVTPFAVVDPTLVPSELDTISPSSRAFIFVDDRLSIWLAIAFLVVSICIAVYGLNRLQVRSWRSLGVRLLIYLVMTSGAASALTAVLVGYASYSQQVRSLRQSLLFTASFTAQRVSGDEMESIRTDGDMYHVKILNTLRDIQALDPQIQFIYLLRKAEAAEKKLEDEELLFFVVDAQEEFDANGNGMIETEEGPAKFLAPYNAEYYGTRMLEGFTRPVVDDDIIEDEWGATLSAYAPIRTSTGKVAGIVGIDVAAQKMVQIQLRALIIGLLAFAGTLVLIVPMALHFTAQVSRPLALIRVALEKFASGDRSAAVEVTRRDEIGMVSVAVNQMIQTSQERDQYRSAFTRYVSPAVAKHLMETPDQTFLKGQRKRITILFADLRNFTPLASRLRPEEVITVLNTYFKTMVEIIFAHNGTLDKFIGDGLMAIFGAPQELEDHEAAAVSAALEMKDAMDSLRVSLGVADLKMGIGINTGIAVVGNVGSEQRMEYTAIGNEVNLASRLESATKAHNVSILISEFTYAAVRHEFKVTRINNVQLKGILEPMTAYAVIDFADQSRLKKTTTPPPMIRARSSPPPPPPPPKLKTKK